MTADLIVVWTEYEPGDPYHLVTLDRVDGEMPRDTVSKWCKPRGYEGALDSGAVQWEISVIKLT